MGKFLKILGVIFLLLIALIVGLLVWAHGEGEQQQQKFFDAVATENTDTFFALFDEKAAKDMDPPVMKMWMKWVNAKLGKYQGLAASDFDTKSEAREKGTLLKCSGTAEFEKGTAKVEMALLNGKIIGFEMESDTLKGNWLNKKPDGDLYRKRADMFIRHLIALEVTEAMPMLHESARKQLTEDGLQKSMTAFAKLSGPLKSIEVIDETFENTRGTKRLTIKMVCTFEKRKAGAFVRFDFDETRGHLIAFRLPAK